MTARFVPSRTADLTDGPSQPLDSDLTAIAALDSSTSGAIASDGAGWVKKTYAQFKTALSLVKGDVGLGNVDNTADASKSVATAAALTTSRTIDGQGFDGSANITVIAPGTHAATGKTTPVDADELPLVDSAASNVLKKLTFANLKAWIQSFTGTGTSTGTNTGDQTITLTGNVTGSGTGSFATTIAAGVVTSGMIADGTVANGDLANMAAATYKGRHTASTGAPEDVSAANVMGDLSGAAAADFSMNSHKFTNLSVPSAAGHSLRWEDIAQGSGPGSWNATFDIVNQNSLTALISQTIPGNTLGANGGLLCVVEGFYLNNSGAGRGIGLAVTYGGTNLWSDATSSTYFAASATAYPFYMQFLLCNEGATNAQRVAGTVIVASNTAAFSAGTGIIGSSSPPAISAFTGTSAVDSTADKILLVRFNSSSTTATQELKGAIHVRVF